MRRSSPTTVVLALVISLFASAAFGQIARVFVSVNGSDGNTCSNVGTPCRTFAGGITQVDDGGEVIVLDTGSYGGTTITKGVTINVPPGVVAFAAQPFTINAPGKNVTLHGLTLKALTPGSGTAVTFTAGVILTIENCVINGWHDGIDVNAAGAPRLIVRDSVFKTMSANGILVQPASGNAFATVVRCQFEHNGNVALWAVENSKVWARDCVFTGNNGAAIAESSAPATPAELDLRNCLFSNNNFGPVAEAASGGTSVTRVSGCMIMGNGNGMGPFGAGATLESYGDNDVRGNTNDTFGTITPIGGTRQ